MVVTRLTKRYCWSVVDLIRDLLNYVFALFSSYGNNIIRYKSFCTLLCVLCTTFPVRAHINWNNWVIWYYSDSFECILRILTLTLLMVKYFFLFIWYYHNYEINGFVVITTPTLRNSIAWKTSVAKVN